LHPGTRLHGARTFVGPRAGVGAEGPATLVDAVLGPDARVDAGYLEGAVLLGGARAGWGAHFRPGTLLEEQTSTAHGVGLKHTILLAFVTLGSLINFCDALMAGGSSRRDHSEVGSGFIHFNFTPWGAHGDKATASLVGDVVDGVLLRQRRIFLGGAGGLVGPAKIGYGAITGAGQVVRESVDAGRLVVQPSPTIDLEVAPGRVDRTEPRSSLNVDYIAQVVALRAWYRQVRLRRVPPGHAGLVLRTVYEAALSTLDACIQERLARLQAFVQERNAAMPALALDVEPPCPLEVAPDPDLDHVTWVQSLGENDVRALHEWLQAVADGVTGRRVGG
jgi:UDP-N-acetylglucosamine/UDP-N-acetylgalactosamine diphosphorylase